VVEGLKKTLSFDSLFYGIALVFICYSVLAHVIATVVALMFQNTTWGWGGISTWGSSMLNTASSSVQTFADSVGE
jgi:hypothetical protein